MPRRGFPSLRTSGSGVDRVNHDINAPKTNAPATERV
jgi:hypothetical protein